MHLFIFSGPVLGSKGNQIVGIVKTALPVSRKQTLKQTKLKFFIFLSETLFCRQRDSHKEQLNNLTNLCTQPSGVYYAIIF